MRSIGALQNFSSSCIIWDRYQADEPKSRALMERKIINRCKFYGTHGQDLCQIDIPGGWPISEAICSTSAEGRPSEPAPSGGGGVVGNRQVDANRGPECPKPQSIPSNWVERDLPLR